MCIPLAWLRPTYLALCLRRSTKIAEQEDNNQPQNGGERKDHEIQHLLDQRPSSYRVKVQCLVKNATPYLTVCALGKDRHSIL